MTAERTKPMPARLHSTIQHGLEAARELLDYLNNNPKMWAMVNDVEVYKFLRIHQALDESVKLQSHYAGLLNAYDGGERMQFRSAEEWIIRLKQLEDQHNGSSTTTGI